MGLAAGLPYQGVVVGGGGGGWVGSPIDLPWGGMIPCCGVLMSIVDFASWKLEVMSSIVDRNDPGQGLVVLAIQALVR